MKSTIKWLQSHRFEAHLIVFLLIVLPALPLYFAAQQGANFFVWGFLSLVILGNLIELMIDEKS